MARPDCRCADQSNYSCGLKQTAWQLALDQSRAKEQRHSAQRQDRNVIRAGERVRGSGVKQAVPGMGMSREGSSGKQRYGSKTT